MRFAYSFILLLFSGYVMAGPCVKTGSICVDPPAPATSLTKTINGLAVTKNCWKYQDTYTCEDAAIDNCSALGGAGCYQHGTPTCTSTAFDGTCLSSTNTMRCDNEQTPMPAGATFAGEFKYIKSDTITNNCQSKEGDATCSLDSEVCVEPAETRIINGLAVTKECWKWERTYTCAGAMDTSECADIQADPTCILDTSICTYLNPDTNLCEVFENKYKCKDGEDGTQTITDCDGQITCVGSYCFNTGSPADEDFSRATTMMEAARQAGIYDQNGIFGGEKGTCHKKSTIGISASCCKVTDPGESANSERYGNLISQAGIGGTIIKNAYRFMGSHYVHDFLFSSTLAPDSLLNSMYGAAGGSAFTPGITYYGVTVSLAPVAGGGYTLGYSFNPYLLAAQLAIQFLITAFQCEMDSEEQMLSLRRGAGLCHFVGSWSEKSSFGLKKTTYQTYCCFNSKLAMIINQQGRAQLGKSWGSAKVPNCGGFTEEELNLINFDNIDFSAFYKEIDEAAKKQTMNQSNLQSIVQDNVNCVAEDNGYDRSTNANCNRDYKPGVVRDAPVLY
jgi:conjugal transfer mating pair stabilization protein TraN